MKDGAIEQTNFDTYNSMRIAEMPKVEIDRHAERPHPVGRRRRADHLVAAPAVLNAYFSGDRQAHPLVPAEEPQPADRLIAQQRRLKGRRFSLIDCGTELHDRSPRHRRQFLKRAAAVAAAFPAPALAQGAGPPVVVIGGGFGGASCARALRKADPRIAVTLVEANATYTALPHSNAVIGGLAELSHQQFGYDKIKSAGVTVALSAATAIDPDKRTVTLADGTTLDYDRLVVSPGIDFRSGAIQGYDRSGHGRSCRPPVTTARRSRCCGGSSKPWTDGGTVVISSPVNPARCPPAPYERASLIAHYLKTKKPKSKVIVLDAKESFTMQKLFEAAWQELYPGMIEWVGLSNGGALTVGRCRDENARDRLRQIQGRRRQRHPAAEGRARRRARRRRRPHRLVPGRSGDVRIQAPAQHPRHRRRRHRRRDAALGVRGAFAGADLRRRHRRAAGRQDAAPRRR